MCEETLKPVIDGCFIVLCWVCYSPTAILVVKYKYAEQRSMYSSPLPGIVNSKGLESIMVDIG